MESLTALRRATGAARCLSCGKCSTMCPLAPFGDFSARLIVGQDLEDEIHGSGVGVGRCLTCASCEVRCPQGIRFTDYVRDLRTLIPPAARRPCPHAAVFHEVSRSLADSGSAPSELEWLEEDLCVRKEGEVALFVGCLPFFDLFFEDQLPVRTLDIARAAIRVLNHLGIEPVLVAEERCCGHDLLWSGDRERFEKLARANQEAFAARGVKHLLTTCAECCRTWRVDYPEAAPGYAPKVQHLAEFLAEKVESGELQFQENGGGGLTFQDPCRLARHLGVAEEPRRVLAAMPGRPLLEMQRNSRDALCCGTSGFIHCDASSRKLQAERLAEAGATGAETLVTACPKCLIHFSCAQTEDRRRGIDSPQLRIQDLTVLAAGLLAESAEPGSREPALAGREAGDTR